MMDAATILMLVAMLATLPRAREPINNEVFFGKIHVRHVALHVVTSFIYTIARQCNSGRGA